MRGAKEGGKVKCESRTRLVHRTGKEGLIERKPLKGDPVWIREKKGCRGGVEQILQKGEGYKASSGLPQADPYT